MIDAKVHLMDMVSLFGESIDMILYTEIQLQEAYREYCNNLPRWMPVPDIEEFRIIFEDYWNDEIWEINNSGG